MMKRFLTLLFGLMFAACYLQAQEQSFNFREDFYQSLKNKAIVNCAHHKTAPIDFYLIGGVAPYRYTLIHNNNTGTPYTTGEIQNSTNAGLLGSLVAGTYELTVLDSKGCILKHRFGVLEPFPIKIKYNAFDIRCKGDNSGAINITGITGGMPMSGVLKYGVRWYDAAQRPMVQWDNQWSITGLTVGTYQVEITDMNTCVGVFEIDIEEPQQSLVPTIIETKKITCFSGNPNDILARDGALKAVATGGTPPYNYYWSSESIKYLGQNRYIQEITGLRAGKYDVRIKDANGCTVYDEYILDNPSKIVINNIKIDDPFCCRDQDGCITFNVSSNGYQLSRAYISPLTTFDEDYAAIENLTATGNKLCGLEPGLHNLVVESQEGCKSTYEFRTVCRSCVSGVAQGISAINPVVTNYPCKGRGDGAMEIASIVVDGVEIPAPFGPEYRFEYLRLGETLPFRPFNDVAATNSLIDLRGGKYIVRVHESLNNSYFTQIVDLVEDYFYFPEDSIDYNLDVKDVSCYGSHDGSISIPIASLVHTYLNSNDADYNTLLATCLFEIVDVRNADHPLFGPASFADPNSILVLDDLPTGTYDLKVYSPAPCEYTSVLNRKILVSGPDKPLAMSLAETKSFICHQDTNFDCVNFDMHVMGGRPPYFVSYKNGGTVLSPSPLPAEQSGIPGVIAFSVPNQFAGNYEIEVRDLFNCLVSDVRTVSYASQIRPIIRPSDVNCYETGHLTIAVPSGLKPYTYSVYDFWKKNVDQDIFDQTDTKQVTPLLAGIYDVTVYDGNNCSYTERKKLTLASQLNLCHEVTIEGGTGMIDLTVSGGIPPYSYIWSNGSRSQDAQNLDAGKFYNVTVTDANSNNCQVYREFQVTGIEDMTAEDKSLYVYPNPTENNVEILTNWVPGSALHIQLVNQLGQVVYHQSTTVTGIQPITVPMEYLPTGVYMINVTSGNLKWTKRVVKE